jgi:hypothetical protein
MTCADDPEYPPALVCYVAPFAMLDPSAIVITGSQLATIFETMSPTALSAITCISSSVRS